MVDIKLLEEIKKRLKEYQDEWDNALTDLKLDIMKVFHAWSEVVITTPRFKPFPMVIEVERVHDISFEEIVNVGAVINKHRLHVKSLNTKERSDAHTISRYLIYTCVPQGEENE